MRAMAVDNRLQAIAGAPALDYPVSLVNPTTISLDGSQGFTCYTVAKWTAYPTTAAAADTTVQIGTTLNDVSSNTYSTYRLNEATPAGSHNFAVRRTGGGGINTNPNISDAILATYVAAWGMTAAQKQWLRMFGTTLTDTVTMAYTSPTTIAIQNASPYHTHLRTIAYPSVHALGVQRRILGWLAARYQATGAG